jgi:hypothetical protein
MRQAHVEFLKQSRENDAKLHASFEPEGAVITIPDTSNASQRYTRNLHTLVFQTKLDSESEAHNWLTTAPWTAGASFGCDACCAREAEVGFMSWHMEWKCKGNDIDWVSPSQIYDWCWWEELTR